MKAILTVGLAVLGSIALASPDVSLRPVARGVIMDPLIPQPHQRPTVRPASEQELAGTVLASVQVPTSRRPILRPADLSQRVMTKRRQAKRGSVCGDIAIQGEKIGFVPGRLRGCGVKNAVQVTSVSGVRLSRPSTMNCPTARALQSWIDKGMTPAARPLGGIQEIKVAAHYACRTRNNQKGARISEHGKGKAIDISGFTLRDGSKITLLGDWNNGAAGKALKRMHSAACGPFGTVLGPESNRFHRDHFHFDTASYRSGPYCR